MIRNSCRISVLALASLCTLASAQSPTPSPDTQIKLHEVLLALQNNVDTYLAKVPDFFCNEDVISRMNQPGFSEKRTTTESLFRLRRDTDSGERLLSENREIKTVDGIPAHRNDNSLYGPAILNGVFSGGAGLVSHDMERCFDYTLQPRASWNRAPAILISFVAKPDSVSNESCATFANETGRAFIDPHTFQVMHMEVRIPDYQAFSNLKVLWRWTVDYTPVTFDNQQFWMPRKILSIAEANDRSANWSFAADYEGCHKFEVRSRILTEDADPSAAPK
jgi:hypothetical protein